MHRRMGEIFCRCKYIFYLVSQARQLYCCVSHQVHRNRPESRPEGSWPWFPLSKQPQGWRMGRPHGLVLRTRRMGSHGARLHTHQLHFQQHGETDLQNTIIDHGPKQTVTTLTVCAIRRWRRLCARLRLGRRASGCTGRTVQCTQCGRPPQGCACAASASSPAAGGFPVHHGTPMPLYAASLAGPRSRASPQQRLAPLPRAASTRNRAAGAAQRPGLMFVCRPQLRMKAPWRRWASSVRARRRGSRRGFRATEGRGGPGADATRQARFRRGHAPPHASRQDRAASVQEARRGLPCHGLAQACAAARRADTALHRAARIPRRGMPLGTPLVNSAGASPAGDRRFTHPAQERVDLLVGQRSCRPGSSPRLRACCAVRRAPSASPRCSLAAAGWLSFRMPKPGQRPHKLQLPKRTSRPHRLPWQGKASLLPCTSRRNDTTWRF